MTRRELWKKINDTDELAELIMYLKCRWDDEKEYEDINDYLNVMKNKIPEAYKIHKRPFGFTFKCSDGDLKVVLKIKGRYAQLFAE